MNDTMPPLPGRDYGMDDAPARYTSEEANAYAAGAERGYNDARAAIQAIAPVPADKLVPVIQWLEAGCDPKHAATELRLLSAAPQPAQQSDAAESVNETNAALASKYFDLLKVVEAYEKHGVTCQTFRHFVDAPCAECNSVPAHQVAHKPLFVEMIAEHPGLRDELLQQEPAQDEPAAIRQLLEDKCGKR